MSETRNITIETGAPNYEAECTRLREENAKFFERIHYLKQENQELQQKISLLEAQLSIVRLIFGGAS